MGNVVRLTSSSLLPSEATATTRISGSFPVAIDVSVGDFICTVEYNYPAFHLTMHCFYCTLAKGCAPTLLEHEAARWLTRVELPSVNWLPADVEVVKALSADFSA